MGFFSDFPSMLLLVSYPYIYQATSSIQRSVNSFSDLSLAAVEHDSDLHTGMIYSSYMGKGHLVMTVLRYFGASRISFFYKGYLKKLIDK